MYNKINDSSLVTTLINVRWERVHLILDLHLSGTNENGDYQFYGVDIRGKAGIYFDLETENEGKVTLRANITNNGLGQCVAEGVYRILVCRGEEILSECMVSPEIAGQLNDFSRNFYYGKGDMAYNVSFSIEDVDKNLPLRIQTGNLSREGLDFPKTTPIIRPITKELGAYFLSTRSISRRVYRFYSFLYKRSREKHVLFMTEQNGDIASNLKSVYERMQERGLDQEYHMHVYARHYESGRSSIFESLNKIKALARSKTIFLDDHAPVLDWLKLDDDQTVIQLWHAGAGFKSSGYSRWGRIGAPAPQSCHRQYSYGIAGSSHIAPFFSEVWGINTERVIPLGMPRMDEYLDEAYRERKTEELYREFTIAKGKKVILFAPTYRGKNKGDAYYPYDRIDLEKLYEMCGNEYVVLFKMHPWVSEDIPLSEKYSNRFVDAKNYPQINDLFYITDLLITDYSSNIFEYSLMRKPMLFYAFDKVQYSFSRGFHRAYEKSAPGKVCYTFEEVLEAISFRNFEYEKVEEYVEKHFDYVDSHASDRVIDWFLLRQMPSEFLKQIQRKDEEVKRIMTLDFESNNA